VSRRTLEAVLAQTPGARGTGLAYSVRIPTRGRILNHFRVTLMKIVASGKRHFLLACAASSLFAAFAAQAQTALDDILKSKVLKVAVQTDSAPYGFVGTDLKPIGLDSGRTRVISESLVVSFPDVSVAEGNRLARPRDIRDGEIVVQPAERRHDVIGIDVVCPGAKPALLARPDRSRETLESGEEGALVRVVDDLALDLPRHVAEGDAWRGDAGT